MFCTDMSGMFIPVLVFKSISEDIEGNSHLLPSNSTELLLPLFQTLHDKGHASASP